MKCSKCNSEWTVPQNLSRSITNCPFCGAALASAPPRQLLTVEDVLEEITDRFGLEMLRNGAKTIALFSDLSPQLTRERRLLSYLIQGNGNVKLLEARNQDAQEQRICFMQVCQYMVDEQFVAEEAARKICMSFSEVIGLSVSDEPRSERLKKESAGNRYAKTVENEFEKATVPPANPNRTSEQYRNQTPAKTSDKQISTYAQYQQALRDYYVQEGKKPLTESQIQQFLAANSLDTKWRITVADVQKDLKRIYAQDASGAASKASAAQINTYAQYQNALKDYYIREGKKPLTESQIQNFLIANSLDTKWRITVEDVQNDLLSIYAQHSANAASAKRVTQINTYAQYQQALEDYYIQAGKKLLTEVQIQQFLTAYSLDKKWKITVADVQSDLKKIYAKHRHN